VNVPARRAVARWGLRLFRREWRQQLLVLLLLTFVVAAAVFIATASYNGVSSPESEFGTANARAGFDEPDAAQRAAAIATFEQWFGPVEVIGHDAVRIPGSVDTIDLRAQRPGGRFGAPMLALRHGKYPTRAKEVALTDQVARELDTDIGRQVTLGRVPRTVVGIVENPRDFSDEFALVGAPEPARG
jgi:putative ABC transport system permease protein